MASNPAQPNRIFIDSSVLIAASISRTGYARDLILMGIDGLVQLVASSFVLEETRRNLARKSTDAVPRFDMFLELNGIHLADPPLALVGEIARQIEPKDAAIVAGAITAHCSTIATFDRRHLLSESQRIQDLWGLQVATPAEIILRLELQGGDE